MSAKHTPTPGPWMAGEEIDACHIYTDDGIYSVIATTDGSDYPEAVENANAAFIVEACNQHAQLVAALVEARHDFINIIVGGCTCGTKPPDPALHELSCHYRMAERGLAGVSKALADVGALETALSQPEVKL